MGGLFSEVVVARLRKLPCVGHFRPFEKQGQASIKYSLLLGEIFRESKYQWRFNNYNTIDLKALHATPIYTCNFILYILAGCTFGTDCLSILGIR